MNTQKRTGMLKSCLASLAVATVIVTTSTTLIAAELTTQGHPDNGQRIEEQCIFIDSAHPDQGHQQGHRLLGKDLCYPLGTPLE